MNREKQIALVVGALVVGILVGYWIFTATRGPSLASPTASTTRETATTSTTDLSNLKIGGTGGGKIEIVNSGANIPPPALYIPTTFSADLSPEAVNILKQNIEKTIAAVRANSRDYQAWLTLGVYLKIAGDYTGARDVWIYVTRVWSREATAYANLADLYLHNFNNPATAETYYLKAISSKPDTIAYYRSLYELYRYSFHDDVKAKAILGQGITTNPSTSADLKYLLDHYSEL